MAPPPGGKGPKTFAEARLTIFHLAAARAPWLHAARMPGVVTSRGIALGEPPWPFQQHSIARHESGLLIGDPTKAKKKLGWVPQVKMEALCREMVLSDIALVEKGDMTS